MDQIDGRDLHPRGIDLAVEQQASLKRPRLDYTLVARFFFATMDLVYGKALTVPKIKLIEILARIPYQAWEIRAYWSLTFGYYDEGIRKEGEDLVRLGRLSQDNEYWHLILALEKIREDRIQESGFWFYFAPKLIALSYAIFARTLATLSMKQAFWFNAQFENHAEHEYAQFVEDHPELDEQPIGSELAKKFGPYETWGQIFRHIGLDERVHRNESLERCGREHMMVGYSSLEDMSGEGERREQAA